MQTFRRSLSRRSVLAGASLGSLAVPLSRASAQGAWPNKTVRFICPFAAGGGTDTVSRLLCDQLGRQLGQQFVVDNKGGAGGNIGTDALAKSAPDGYTIGVIAINMLVINPHLYKDMPYDPVKDFEPIMHLTSTNHVLAIHSSVPSSNLKEFVAWVKANPCFKHLGLYAYQADLLEKFAKLPPGRYEVAEKLEQLRALEMGMQIWAAVIDEAPLSVDNPADLEAARALV